MTSVVDHLRALGRSIGGEPLVWSSGTITRATIENAARASWLMDPTIGYRERVGRFVSRQMHSLEESRKAGMPMRSGEAPEDVLARLQEWARVAGYVVERPRRGAPFVPPPAPSATELAGQLLGPGVGDHAYRLYSQSAHGTVGGLLSAMETVDADAGLDGLGQPVLRKADLWPAVAVAQLSMMSVLRLRGAAFGWSITDINSWDTHVRSRMHALSPVRDEIQH